MTRRKFRLGIAVALWLGASIVAVANDDLVPHHAVYKIEISVLGGILETKLELDEGAFKAESSIRPTGLAAIFKHGEITEWSRFAVHDSALRSLDYGSDDSLAGKEKHMTLEFDWLENKVVGLIDGSEFSAGLETHIVDRSTLQYALIYDLLNHQLRSEYILQDGENRKILTVLNKGTRVIEVPFGTFEAVGIQHRAGKSSRETTLWFAEALGYLPIVIEQHRNGKLRGRVLLKNFVID